MLVNSVGTMYITWINVHVAQTNLRHNEPSQVEIMKLRNAALKTIKSQTPHANDISVILLRLHWGALMWCNGWLNLGGSCYMDRIGLG